MTIHWSSGTAEAGFNAPGALYHLETAPSPAYTGGSTIDTYAIFNNFGGLSPNTTYYSRVRAINSDGAVNYEWLVLGATATLAAQPSGVSLTAVVCLLEDREGTLWFGTSGDGLVRRDSSGFHVLTTRDGLVSDRMAGEWPKNVWSVTDDGFAMEAQLENSNLGTYHGYPMPETDPLSQEVIRRWERING